MGCDPLRLVVTLLATKVSPTYSAVILPPDSFATPSGIPAQLQHTDLRVLAVLGNMQVHEFPVPAKTTASVEKAACPKYLRRFHSQRGVT